MSRIDELFKVERHRWPAYRIIYKANGCRVIEGPVPVDDFAALGRAWSLASPDAELVAHEGLAARLGASFVIGPKAVCSAWYERLGEAAGELLRYRLVDEPYPGITCIECGRTSYNGNDIKHRYCGNCKTYLDD